MTQACMRCRRLTLLTDRGLLRLCAACLPHVASQPCAPMTHDWRGSVEPGTWVCLTCASVLGPQDAGTASGEARPVYGAHDD